MRYDYSDVRDLGAGAFEEMKSAKDKASMTKSDADDLAKIELALDLRKDLLANEEYYVGKAQCTCGRTLTFYDFVYTSLRDADHSKSFVAHTLLGSKFVINRSRQVRCSDCNSLTVTMDYITPQYCCCRDDGISPVEDDVIPVFSAAAE